MINMKMDEVIKEINELYHKSQNGIKANEKP